MERSIIDIHAHILPEIDDGAKNWEESKRMLDISIAMGIRTIIATPHYSRHLPVEKVRELVSKLEEEAQKLCPEFKVYCGQEILYFDSIVEILKEKAALTLAESRYVLVEFMPEVAYQKLYQGVRNILRGGYYPVVAHVERYGVLRREKNIEELLETGCFLQLNYSSLKGNVFDTNARWCRKQITEKRIHLLGTDMHHDTWRSPDIEGSLSWLEHHTDPEEFGRLTRDQAMKILASVQHKAAPI